MSLLALLPDKQHCTYVHTIYNHVLMQGTRTYNVIIKS